MRVSFTINRHFLILFVAALLTAFRSYDDLFEYSKNLEILNAAYREVGKNFVDEIKPGDLMKKGLDAMLASLDPYTVYYSESQTEEALLDRQGEYSGVGCRVFLRNQFPVVSEVFAGYAFSKADVRPGDILLRISGQSMKGKSIGEISVFLRGAPETEFQVELDREGEIITKTITRVQVTTKNVPYYGMVDAETGYIKLDQFGPKCSQEIGDALKSMGKDGNLKYLVLDLRDNGGGLLNEAVNIVGFFTRTGELVVKMKGRTSQSNRDWTTQVPALYPDLPLVVLVNNQSASASEVVSGSLQDLDRAVIVGRNSFGKGLVQNYFQLPYRTQMKITTAKYYTPSGRCIQLLDYRHRNNDGSAGTMPDSLRTAFKTRNGRTVYDGGGIKPDIVVDEFQGQPLLKFMAEEKLMFDYVNHYRNSHETIAPAKDFELTADDFNYFVSTLGKQLSGKIYEKLKTSLTKSVQDESFIESLLEKAAIQSEIEKMVNEKLVELRKPLQYRLKREILGRYYSDAQLYESSFSGDPDITSALQIIKDAPGRQRLLQP